MKKNIILICILLSSIMINAQKINMIVYDNMAEENILLGYCNREGLSGDDFNYWFQAEYKSYSIDIETLDKLNINIFSSLEIKVVMGTWCSDSQREIPRFFKILDQIAFNFDNITFIGVNRMKQAKETDADQLNIELVPTIIFYKDGEEIGRIIESPKESLEKDIIRVLSNV